MDPKGLEAVKQVKDFTSHTIGEICKIAGLLGVYHRKIPNFSEKAKPIYDLLKGPEEKMSNQKKQRDSLAQKHHQ
jgi:hypothetical protein